jgi:hypothetical protein
MRSTGGNCFHPEDEENLELHQSLTEVDEQELAVLATDVAFTDTESAEH